MSLPIPEFEDLQPDDEVSVEELPHPPMQHIHSIARVLALQALYELDVTGHSIGEVLNALLARLDTPLSQDVIRYMGTLVNGVQKHRETIDAAIQPFAPEFPIRLLAVIDRCILRLAVFEYGMARLVPVGVAIDEAVGLAKQYGSEASPRFINGVLGNLMDRADVIEHLHAIYQPA